MWRSDVTHSMNQLCHTCGCVTWPTHMCDMVMSRIHMCDMIPWHRCQLYQWVMSHVWMSHVTHMCESCHTYEWVMSPESIRFVIHMNAWCNGVATISRLLKTIGLFCKRALLKSPYSAKGTYNCKEPTNRSHPPISGSMSHVTYMSESCHHVTYMSESCHLYQ